MNYQNTESLEIWFGTCWNEILFWANVPSVTRIERSRSRMCKGWQDQTMASAPRSLIKLEQF